MTRLVAPFAGPEWLPEYTRSIERALDDARDRFHVTATGTGASQDITLPRRNLRPQDVLVFEAGALRWDDYTITDQTLTLTATASAALVILER